MNRDYRESFSRRLSDSRAAQIAVVKYINGQGMPCSINPSIMAPAGEDPSKYKDGGDIYMHFRTEVKHRPKMDFTGPETYPFNTVIICAKESFDSQAVSPKFYFICNGPMTHAALVDVRKTKDQWFVESMPDHERGYVTDCYTISKGAVNWITL